MKAMLMRTIIGALFIFTSFLLRAQDGKIFSKEPIALADTLIEQFGRTDREFANKLRSIDFHRITYLSDDLKVTGYLAEPKAPGKYPCIISNRGGNRDFGQWDTVSMAYFLGNMASWD